MVEVKADFKPLFKNKIATTVATIYLELFVFDNLFFPDASLRYLVEQMGILAPVILIVCVRALPVLNMV